MQTDRCIGRLKGGLGYLVTCGYAKYVGNLVSVLRLHKQASKGVGIGCPGDELKVVAQDESRVVRVGLLDVPGGVDHLLEG